MTHETDIDSAALGVLHCARIRAALISVDDPRATLLMIVGKAHVSAICGLLVLAPPAMRRQHLIDLFEALESDIWDFLAELSGPRPS